MNLPTGVSVAAGILIAAKWLAQLWLDRLNEKSVRDHAAIAGFGKARAGVVGEPANDLAFASVDDHIGDRLRHWIAN